MRTRAIAGTSSVVGPPAFIPAFCFSTDAVGDFVYIMGNKVGVNYQVTKVDIDTTSKMPAVGVIISKSSPTDCVVQVAGVVRGLYSGLVYNKRQFIGSDSRPATAFVRPLSNFRLVQVLGIAISSDEILLRFETPTVILPV